MPEKSCKLCDLYGICEAHTAGCVKDPDEGCPFYRYFKKIFQPTTKNDLGVTKAIEILRADNIASYSVEDVLSARDMAIKALEQEPTTENNLGVDCIDRKALLNRLNDFNKWCKDGRLPGSMFAVDVIKDMPSVTPQPRWITLSEKWPEDCQKVLVITGEGNIVTDVFHVDSRGCHFEGRDIEYVTAWMPLPESYKPESEDKK